MRTDDGALRVASGRKLRLLPGIETPVVRGPLRLAEGFAVLPAVRKRLPEARFPFASPSVIAAFVACSVTAGAIRRSALRGLAREVLAGGISLVPAVVALRGGELAAYHGAEHVSIGSYERDEEAERTHERCGSHLIGPLLLTTAVAKAAAEPLPSRIRRPARLLATVGAVGVAVEIFSWMVQNPGHAAARALAAPGRELQERLSTAEPSADQLAVANAALAACLELED